MHVFAERLFDIRGHHYQSRHSDGHLITFSGNSAPSRGGAIYNYRALTVEGSTFTDNTAGFEGGAIYNPSGATVTVASSTFTGDTADDGGAIENYGTATVQSSTFSGDTGNRVGGESITTAR